MRFSSHSLVYLSFQRALSSGVTCSVRGEQVKNEDYPCILLRLFPGHPARRLLCTSVDRNESGGAKKKVVTIHRGARLEDYSKHLDRKSYDGVGALGVIPTFSERLGEKTRWFVWFLGLDYDSISLQDVMKLVAVLEEYRV